MSIDLTVDAHVHSNFSDGRDHPATNVAVALGRGLKMIGLVDHVRADTTWLPEFSSTVRRLNLRSPIHVTCGVEAKLLDTTGRLDLPGSLREIDSIVAADHQVPIGSQTYVPASVARMISDKQLKPADVIENILEATAAAAERYDNVLIAHLFSVLPKCGLTELMVSENQITALGRRLANAGGRVEISERWACPSAHTAKLLWAEGVELVASTDSHRADTIGRYRHVADVAGSLALL
mgnify:FL=1